MSGYRSLKRVLGESNLESKCRWLFGICVGGLIFLSFWWVDRISEGLIEETAQSKGSGLVTYSVFDLHWQWWTLRDEGEERQKPVAVMNNDLAKERYAVRILYRRLCHVADRVLCRRDRKDARDGGLGRRRQYLQVYGL